MEEADHVLTMQELNGLGSHQRNALYSLVGIFLVICAHVSPSICYVSLHPTRYCSLAQLLSRSVCPTMAPLDNALWGLSQVYPSSWAFGIALVLLPKISVWT